MSYFRPFRMPTSSVRGNDTRLQFDSSFLKKNAHSISCLHMGPGISAVKRRPQVGFKEAEVRGGLPTQGTGFRRGK